MFAGQALRTVMQTLYFVFLARALSVSQFGSVAAVTAVTSLLSAFAGWGTGGILVMEGARDRSKIASLYGGSLGSTLATLVPLSALGIAAGRLFIPSLPFAALAAFLAADLLFARIVDTTAQAFQAAGVMRKSALIGTAGLSARAAAAALFLVLAAGRNANAWSFWYVASSLVGCGIALAATRRWLGPVPLAVTRPSKIGFYFAIGVGSNNSSADIDKTMLARMDSLSSAGVYAAGYRVVAMAFVPLLSLFLATYPRFFRAGISGVAGTTQYARRLLPTGLLYATIAAVTLWVSAPAASDILGGGYTQAAGVIRWLSPLPVILLFCYLGGDVLTGAGLQGTRSALQIAAAIFNVGANVALIPLYGWQGAAAATLVTYSSLAAAFWVSALLVQRPATGVMAQ